MNQRKYIYDFHYNEKIRSVVDIIYTSKASIVEDDDDQSNILKR